MSEAIPGQVQASLLSDHETRSEIWISSEIDQLLAESVEDGVLSEIYLVLINLRLKSLDLEYTISGGYANNPVEDLMKVR